MFGFFVFFLSISYFNLTLSTSRIAISSARYENILL